MNTYEIETLSAMKRGAVTLCLGSSTGANITGSLQIAREIAQVLRRGKVLYINTVQTKRQIAASQRRVANAAEDAKTKQRSKKEKGTTHGDSDSRHEIEFITSNGGHLSAIQETVYQSLQAGAKFVIINSMEFSSKDYRRKDELIFQIMEWTNIFGAGVLVFGETSKTSPRQGKIQRGGCVGKLAAVASSIIFSVQSEDEFLLVPNTEEEEEEYRYDEEIESIHDEDIPFIIGTASIAEICEEEEKIDPNWKPKDVKEEVKITDAYMLNHPEFKKRKGESWLERRMRTLILIDRQKKRRQSAADGDGLVREAQQLIDAEESGAGEMLSV